MKTKLTYPLIALLLGGLTLSAQAVREESRGMVRGVKNATIVELPGAPAKVVEKKWNEFMKKYGKVEKVKRSNEMIVQGANLVNYTDVGRVNLFAEVLQGGEETELALWIEADSIWVNSKDHPEGHKSVVSLLQDFAHKVELDLIQEVLTAEQKILDKYENNLKKLVSKHDSYRKTIETSHANIAKAEDNIVKNQTEQETTSAEIDGYTDVSADPDAVKQVKKLEKTMVKLKKQNLNYHNAIASNKAKIVEAEANLETNATEQETAKEAIAGQEVVVQEIRDRLKATRERGPGVPGTTE